MKHHNLPQGSPQWHAHRRQHFNASDAPAMLGCSPYKTRAQLLHELHTGLTTDVDAATQRRFDDGHRFEALARPLAELIIGEDLYPVVGSEGKLSASFDGLTMAEDIAFEHKSLNQELRECMEGEDESGRLPKQYRVQMEQQLLVSGAARVLFMASKWEGEQLVEARHCWYASDPALRAEILAGWKQFDADLAAYVPPAASAVEKIVAEPVEALPAVSVRVEGSIVIHENFDVFEVAMRDFLDHRLIREPKTDQDFADLERQIKAMKGAEAALDGAEASWIAQIETVSEKKRRKDMLRSLVRDNRLLAEKLLTGEKERRRGDIVASGVKALADHVSALNARLGKPYMPQVPTDFGGCIKGLKSLASMEDKVATELARMKIAANEIADRIDANLKTLAAVAPEHAALFPDTATIVQKAPEDLQALVRARVAEHDAAVKRRAEEAAEKERARIRAEEEARAAEKVRQEQEALARERRQREESEAEQRRQEQERMTHANGAPMFGTDVKENGDRIMLDDQGKRSIFCDVDEGDEAPRPPLPALQQAAGPAVIPMPTKAPAAPASPPTLMLREINARMAPISIDAAGLASMGFPHAATDKSAKLYHEATFPEICDALIAHLARAKLKRAA